MLRLECTLPIPASFCLHKATTAKFYLFTESDKDLLEKILEDMVGGPSILFTGKAVVGETFIQDSTNWCKSLVGIDDSQLDHFFMCQAMATGLRTRWELNSKSGNFKPRQKTRRRVLKLWSCHTFSVSDHSMKWNASTRQVHKKMMHTVLMFSVDTGTFLLQR